MLDSGLDWGHFSDKGLSNLVIASLEQIGDAKVLQAVQAEMCQLERDPL